MKNVGLLPTFANPYWLLLLPGVPLLVWWWLRQHRGAVRFSSAVLLVGLPAGRERRWRRVGAALRGLGLTLLVLALAGPRWPDPGTRLPTYGISIVLAVDVSRSMEDRDFLWDKEKISRLEAAKKVFRLFVAGGKGPDGSQLAGRPNDLIGLITFATRPETACPLTLNHDVVLQLLQAEEPRTVPGEGTTNLGDALVWAVHRLDKAPTRRKVLVVLTDGEHNVDKPALKPRQAGQLAGNLGIPIYAINAGSNTSSATPPPPLDKGGNGGVTTSAAEEARKAKQALQTLAAMTQGKYFQAGDTTALVEVCEEIDRLERQEILSLQYRRYYEGFAWFALASLGVWILVQILESTVWRRSP